MRTKKLPTTASLVNYDTGPRIGLATKIVPPTANFTNGKVPSAKHAAQWQNYLEYWLQQQVEVGAAVPYQNWTSISNVTAVSGTTPSFSYNSTTGSTLVSGIATANAVGIISDVTRAMFSRTITPAAGTFVPRDNCFDPINKYWIVVGSNSSATSKSIWQMTANTQTEITAPAAGTIDRVTCDRTTGICYAFLSDTNRTVLSNAAAGVWAVHSTRTNVANAATSVAANNGEMLVVESANGPIQYYSSGAWAFRSDVCVFGDTQASKKVFYSKAQESWLISADVSGFTVAATAAAGAHTTTAWVGSENKASASSCLHEMGYANFGLGGTTASLYLQTDLDLPLKPQAKAYDSVGSGASWGAAAMYYDGSALYLYITLSAAAQLYRSMRSNAPQF